MVQVFTKAELAQCGNVIRIPELTRTPERLLLFAQCRKAQMGGNQTGGAHVQSSSMLGDSMVQTKVISKASFDGLSWTNFTVHTPVSYSSGMAIYDRVRKRVVLQYQHYPTADQYTDLTLYQRVSTDNGLSWGEEQDITAQVKGCNPHAPRRMQVTV